jgi:hypothetical protein
MDRWFLLQRDLGFIRGALPNLDDFDRSACQRDRHAPSHDQTRDLVPRIADRDSGLHHSFLPNIPGQGDLDLDCSQRQE